MKRIGYSIDFQCDVQQGVRAATPNQSGPVLSDAELALVARAWTDGLSAERTALIILAARERRAVA